MRENLISISQKHNYYEYFSKIQQTARAASARTEIFCSIARANMIEPSDVKPKLRVTQPLAGLKYALKMLKTVPEIWI